MNNKKKFLLGLADLMDELEASIDPIKQSLDSMTAERGKWLRKLKRAGINRRN